MVARSLRPRTVYRVILKSVPPDAETRERVRAALADYGLPEGEIGRILTQLPYPVATGLPDEQARQLSSSLVKAGADVDVLSPPLGSQRPTAASRAARAQKDRTNAGWVILAALVVGTGAIWFVIPSSTRLLLRDTPGSRIRFTRSIELEQMIQRMGGSVEVKGTIRYQLDRTVQAVSPEEIVVSDRFVEPVFDLIVSGGSAEAYNADVEKLKQRMASAEVVRTYSRNGKLKETRGEEPLQELDPYPGYVDDLLGEMSFPPHAVKAGKGWASAIDLERSIEFTTDSPEVHGGVKTLPASFDTVSSASRYSVGSSFASSGVDVDLSGRVWFDVRSGWPVETNVELRRQRFSSGAGNFSMDKVRAQVTQTASR